MCGDRFGRGCKFAASLRQLSRASHWATRFVREGRRMRGANGAPAKNMPPPCSHGRQRYFCRECGGGGICEHGRRRSRCKECGGSGICEHGRRRSQCKDCGGASICEHGRRRCYCKECGGASICEHGRRRNECKECGGSRQDAVILEATVVEVDEDAESDDQWIPVQSYTAVAAGPRGGKRKR